MKNIFVLTFFYFLLATTLSAVPLSSKVAKEEAIKVEQYELDAQLSKKERRKLEKKRKKMTNKKEKIIAFFEKIYANTPLAIGLAALVTGGFLALINHFLFLGLGFFTWLTAGILLGGLFLVIWGLRKNK